jgi:large subunit ribosomal protein L25
VYGGGSEPRSIVVKETVLRAALTGDQGRNAILHVSIDGGPTVPSILKAWQVDPIKDKLRHIDLLEIALDKAITSNVSVVLVGVSPGAKIGGALTQLVHQVKVQAVPTEIPSQLQIDISNLQVGGMLRIADIDVPKGATVLDDPETIVVSVAATRRTAGIAPAAPAAPAAAAAPEASADEPAAEAAPDDAAADDAAE